jgi:hypothetical protein
VRGSSMAECGAMELDPVTRWTLGVAVVAL